MEKLRKQAKAKAQRNNIGQPLLNNASNPFPAVTVCRIILYPLLTSQGARIPKHQKTTTAAADKRQCKLTDLYPLARGNLPLTPSQSHTHPVKALGLKEMPVHAVELPPSSGSTTVD